MTPSTTDPLDWIRAQLHRAPDRLGVETDLGRRYTYADLEDEAARFAQLLNEHGVARGDRVLVQIEKCVESLTLYLGCLRLGAVFVPVNTANTPAELQYFANDAQPTLAILRPDDAPGAQALRDVHSIRATATLAAQHGGSLGAALASANRYPDPRPMDGQLLGSLIYTSGTTGRSKGAMLTRANIASNGVALASAWHFTASDVVVHVLPMFHVHGLFAALSTTLAAGASLRFENQFDVTRTIEHFSRSTVFMGVPTHYTRLLQSPLLTRDATRSMRLFVSGSAPLLVETHERFERQTGHVILERYGMTETLMNTSNPYAGERRAGTVGMPLPGVHIRLAKADEAEPIGEIHIKGPNVCAGYWQDAEKTQAAWTADGWFKSGDLGSIDERGYVSIVGRAKDLIISGGYNVYPKEIETELDALPGVLESAVFGVMHPDFGEGVTAAVVPQSGAVLEEAQLLTALSTVLAKYKCPKRILVLSELPRNTMGKVQKNLLRKTYEHLYARS